mmetsp:Transcript_23408/g.41951  ORF Transcript_23408/g.41951 Transcript_23408/m.41951 type:complete len:85 (-) Transcript_23408:1077-1331(-)
MDIDQFYAFWLSVFCLLVHHRRWKCNAKDAERFRCTSNEIGPSSMNQSKISTPPWAELTRLVARDHRGIADFATPVGPVAAGQG